MSNVTAPHTRNAFKVAIICALSLEVGNVLAVFDRCWDEEGRQYGKTAGDQNTYTTGMIGEHNVVLVHMPYTGSNSAAQATADLRSSYPQVQLVVMVGICGVAPVHPQTQEEILLGDVVISTAVIQYDSGRHYPEHFQQKREVDNNLGRPSPAIRTLVQKLQTQPSRQRMTTNLARLMQSDKFRKKVSVWQYPGASEDWLYEASYMHQHRESVQCAECDDGRQMCPRSCQELGCEEDKRVVRNRHCHPKTKDLARLADGIPIIHFGRVGSANTVMKSGLHRDSLVAVDDLIAFEMEAAGWCEQFSPVLIKAACDYADSHRSTTWQAYAAAVAAGSLSVFLQELKVADEFRSSDTPRSLGILLTLAPLSQSDEFVGRTVELDAVHHLLRPDKTTTIQRQVVLGGIGGVGKTQLAIAYARRYGHSYTSVLWFNASSEQTLHASFRMVAEQLVPSNELEKSDNEQMLTLVKEWLSRPYNQPWLLIFDNYDDPDQFDIDIYYPDRSHGSIIVTTRSLDRVKGQSLHVQPLTQMADSLALLQTRSGRGDLGNDIGARALVERLAGLPLALAIAGAYLRMNPITFQQYLNTYEQQWQYHPRQTLQHMDYTDHTLHTAWGLSYSRLKADDPDAAQMLRLLAYFDNQNVWYELFRAGLSKQAPSWLSACLATHISFESVMSTLVDYSLVELQRVEQLSCIYGMHSCTHDWSLRSLNTNIDAQLYWYAFDCVAASLDKNEWETLGHVRYTQACYYTVRLTHPSFIVYDQFGSSLVDCR